MRSSARWRLAMVLGWGAGVADMRASAQTGRAQTAHAPAARAHSTDARSIAASALHAAESGVLDHWEAPWQARRRTAPHDRLALFAAATAERLRYRHAESDTLLGRVLALGAVDALARQAQLWRAIMDATRGRHALVAPALLRVEQASLAAADTLTALDALLARTALVLRTGGASDAEALLTRGDALGWARDPALVAAARCRTAMVRSRLGERDAARRLAREGAAIATRAGLQRLAAGCLFTLGTDFARSGLTDSLRGPLLRALDIQRRTGDLAGLAATSQWAGYYTAVLGHYPAAQQYLKTAWTASLRAGTVDVSAWTALSRAAVAQSFFDAAGTTLWLARADSLMRIVDDPQGRIEVARQRARHATVLGDVDGARAHLHRALALAERTAEPAPRMSMVTALRELELRNGNLDSAAHWLEAEGMLMTTFQMPGWESSHRAAQGELALRRGDYRESLRHLDATLATMHPSQHSFRHDEALKRALALAMDGDTRAAARAALGAADVFDRWRASLSDSALRLLAVQSQRGRGWFTSSLIAALADAGEVPVAFAVTERRRARDLRDRLAMASPVPRPDMRPRALMTTDSVSDVAALQRAIPDDETAVITLDAGEGGTRGTAFVLTRRALTAHALPSVEAIAPRVRRLVALLEGGRKAEPEARALGDALLAPLLPRLDSAGTRRIVFVPEGVLHRLPFDVLRLPDGRTVLERFETAVAPSVTVLVRLRQLPATGATPPRVLAYADPESPRTIADAPESGSPPLFEMLSGARRLPRLPGARAEVIRVQRLLPGTVRREGALARESSFKREAAQFDVLHVAAHAMVDEWSGASAAIVLTPGDGDDGLLDAGEIATLRLPSSLVVLSACRTVGGEVIAGEGVRGLTSAFLQAGARSVVATAWRVDDGAVAPLVSAMYESLARGQPIGSALRTARLAAVRRGVPASAWGAFTLVGDPWRALATVPAPVAPARD